VAYLARAVDGAVTEILQAMGGVLLEGPRGCGKTSTGLHHARSHVRLDDSPQQVELASLDPRALLRGATPRLIDEWQLAPEVWNAVRREIDERQQRGQFILAGSSSPREDPARHSGAGRIGRIRMRPMSLAESGRSTGEISLSGLRGADSITGRADLGYAALAEAAVVGGWPALLDATSRQAMTFNRSYCDDLCSTDIRLASGVRHDPIRVRRLLASIARNLAGEATLATFAEDVSADGGSVGPETIRRYLDALSATYALDELPAWSVALRSKSRLRVQSKLHLADPALACAALGIGPDRLAADPEFFGQVFESMVVRDVRALAGADEGRVYHYRDNTGLEVDAIIEYPDGSWAAIEAKLGHARIAEAEGHLLTLRDARVDVDKVGLPAFLAVVTGTEFAYTLQSGVHVVPLAAFGT
jgi:predicted AAA+ superfamily ATPase